MIKIFDLFAGIGGFRLAAEKSFKKNSVQSKFIGWCELDKYCQITYKSNFHTHNEFFIDDIKKVTNHGKIDCNEKNYDDKKRSNFINSQLPKFDLLFAGFPCQSFSRMGNERSLNDSRGALFFDIAAILSTIKPRYFILENVYRILTIDNKKTIETIKKILDEIGYYVDIFILDSKEYGVPQTRRRAFIYGFKKSLKIKFPQIYPPKKKLNKTTLDLLDKNVDTKYHLSKKILKTILSDGTGGYYQKSEIDLKIARPLTKTMVKMHRAHQDNYFSNNYILGENRRKWVRKLTPTEAFRLQGFPDSFVKNSQNSGISDTQLYMQAGNAVTVNTVEAILNLLLDHNWFK